VRITKLTSRFYHTCVLYHTSTHTTSRLSIPSWAHRRRMPNISFAHVVVFTPICQFKAVAVLELLLKLSERGSGSVACTSHPRRPFLAMCVHFAVAIAIAATRLDSGRVAAALSFTIMFITLAFGVMGCWCHTGATARYPLPSCFHKGLSRAIY